MKWLIYLILLAIGVAAIAVPTTTGWDPESAKGAVGFGIGVIVATIYMLVRGLTGRAGVGGVGGGAGVVVTLGLTAWYDWVVIGVAVFGGALIGMLA